MKASKRVRGETPSDRALADRIARAKAPDRNAGWYEQAAELATDTSTDVNDVLDHFDERASIREYEGNTTRADAEREAWRETELHYRRQGNLL